MKKYSATANNLTSFVRRLSKEVKSKKNKVGQHEEKGYSFGWVLSEGSAFSTSSTLLKLLMCKDLVGFFLSSIF